MKTKIKIKDLQKIFNPLSDTIKYLGNKFNLDIKSIQSKVENPGSYLFEQTNEIEHFHNQVANTILNYEKNKGISLNLESEDVSKSVSAGLLHYIASIYLKEPIIFVEIQNNLTADQFIKSKKLTETEEEFELFNDNDYLNDSINFKDEILVNNFFSWFSGNEDSEKDLEFFIKELKNIPQGKSLLEIYQQIPESIKETENFLYSILVKDKTISSNIIEAYFLGDKHEKISSNTLEMKFFNSYPIDLNTSEIKELIFNLNETEFISVVKKIHEFTQNHYSRNNNTLYYLDEIYNDQRVINYCLNNSNSKYYTGKDFNIKNIYPYFNNELKLNKDLVLSYIQSIESDSGERYIMESELTKVPVVMFKDFDILNRCSHSISFKNLKDRFSREGESPLKLSREQTLEIVKNISHYKFDELVQCFYDKKKIDADFAKEVLKMNRGIESQFFAPFFKDLDFSIFIVEHTRKDFKSINFTQFIKPHLFREDLTEKQESFLINYMITTKKILETPAHLDIPTTRLEEYKQKYYRPEFMFYKVDDWSSWRNDGIKMVKKLKDVDSLTQFFENCRNLSSKHNISHAFDCQAIFDGIHPTLKNNHDVIFSFLKNIGSNVDLSSSNQFLYNKNNCLELIEKHPFCIKHVPEHMYFDKEFSLAFAKHLDKGGNLSTAPIKVKKFFEQKDVKESYLSFLTSFISYHELQKNIKENDVKPVLRKMKI